MSFSSCMWLLGFRGVLFFMQLTLKESFCCRTIRWLFEMLFRLLEDPITFWLGSLKKQFNLLISLLFKYVVKIISCFVCMYVFKFMQDVALKCEANCYVIYNFFPSNAFLRRRRKKALLRVNDRGGGWRMCILGLCRVCVTFVRALLYQT